MTQLPGEQLRAEPALAAGSEQQVLQESLETGDRVHGRVGGRPQPRRDGGHSRLIGGSLGPGHGVLGQGHDARQLLDRHLRVQPRRRPPRQLPELAPRGRQDGGRPVEAGRDGRQPDRKRREVAGQQREDSAAQKVDVAERVPGVLTQLRLVEAQGRQLG